MAVLEGRGPAGWRLPGALGASAGPLPCLFAGAGEFSWRPWAAWTFSKVNTAQALVRFGGLVTDTFFFVTWASAPAVPSTSFGL